MHDMDVARNRTTDDQAHWVVWNIPATATGFPKVFPRARNCRTAAIKSVPPVRCIAVLAHRRPVRGITTCSSSLPWTPSSMFNRRGRRIRDARECLESDAGTHSRERRSTADCSGVRSRAWHSCRGAENPESVVRHGRSTTAVFLVGSSGEPASQLPHCGARAFRCSNEAQLAEADEALNVLDEANHG